MEHLTKLTFIEKVFDYEKNKEWKFKGNTPVIIDFYADWCGPCKKMSPILEQLNKEYDGKIIFYKIDTQKEQELANVFGITGIPAFLFIPVEGEPQMSMGYSDKPTFEKTITDILKVSK
ncbi:MAG: thiol reductase thioredoxin [Bacteroidetes bacterium GWF2_33_38]|nr:MAG: thiol reductase thioredoxin [Bacteroidetes bacterium GWF2_33_38]OFY71802.1 MAG: thiol reductase thioredoxin [Bacteroidetes bacterium RIFOXYA12_FULL_33_9]OFY90295.1 MAG: thiol reductase thioredoxin [Bacteroidetes bacterium RIFOXYA2_FULL_33_7]